METNKVNMEELYGRIERLTGWRASKGLFVSLALAWFFAFYELVLIGFALPSITQQFHLTVFYSSLVISLNLFGYVIGAILMGNVADYLGRRKAFLITILILTIGAIGTALSVNLPMLLGFRTLDGAGVGAEISIASVFVAELAPKNSRARINQAEYMAAAFALAAGGLVTYALVTIFPLYGWRISYVIIIVVAIAGIFLRKKNVPDTPRWLAIHNQFDEAEEVVEKMEKEQDWYMEENSGIKNRTYKRNLKTKYGEIKELSVPRNMDYSFHSALIESDQTIGIEEPIVSLSKEGYQRYLGMY